MLKIGVNTHYTESYEPLADIVIPNLKIYCDKQNYDLMITKRKDEKFHFIKVIDTRILLNICDLVFTIELDAMITNHNIRIESFLDAEHDVYLCNDINGPNGGVTIAKDTKWAKDWFDFVISKKNVYGDEQNVYENNNHEKIKYCQHPAFNSIPYEYYAPSYGYINWEQYEPRKEKPTHEMGCWEVGDFVCHLPGKTLNERIEIFNQIKEHIIL